MKYQREVIIRLDCDREFLDTLEKEIQTILHEAQIEAWSINIDAFHSERPLIGDKGGFIDQLEKLRR